MKWTLSLAVVALSTGCALFQSKPPAYTLRFHEEAQENLPESRSVAVTVEHPHRTLHIDPFPWISERDVVSAKLEPTLGGDAVLITLDPHGTSKLMEMTTRLRGQYYVIMVNSRPVA